DAQFLLPGVNDLPGGPTTSLVLTFQGDRLDPGLAEDPSNYNVTWLGRDGVAGTKDDRAITPAAAIYNPSANVDVSTGRTYPTAVRQTVTLLFDEALPAGSYRVEVSPSVGAAAFSTDEPARERHSVVSITDGAIAE